MSKKTKMVAATAIGNNVLDLIKADVKVDMNDLTNVFIVRYEQGLVLERTSNQQKLKTLNEQIKVINEEVLVGARAFVKRSGAVGEFSNPLFKTTVRVDDKDYTVKWELTQVVYTIRIESKSTTSTNQYNKETSGSFQGQFDIDAGLVDQYNDLMAEKANITLVLTEINNSLRDVSRKEREIRGKITEQKFAALGMEELLVNPDLLMLIDTSNLVG